MKSSAFPSPPILVLPLIGALWLGCAAATAPTVVIPDASPGSVAAKMRIGRAVGGVVPIAVGVTNATSDEYIIAAERIEAVDAGGVRIAALSVAEASARSGDADAIQRIATGALGRKAARPGESVGGVVFFPDGTYYSLRVHAEHGDSGELLEVVAFKAL